MKVLQARPRAALAAIVVDDALTELDAERSVPVKVTELDHRPTRRRDGLVQRRWRQESIESDSTAKQHDRIIGDAIETDVIDDLFAGF